MREIPCGVLHPEISPDCPLWGKMGGGSENSVPVGPPQNRGPMFLKEEASPGFIVQTQERPFLGRDALTTLGQGFKEREQPVPKRGPPNLGKTTNGKEVARKKKPPKRREELEGTQWGPLKKEDPLWNFWKPPE